MHIQQALANQQFGSAFQIISLKDKPQNQNPSNNNDNEDINCDTQSSKKQRFDEELDKILDNQVILPCKMYFIVHLIKPQIDVIVPANWIKGINDQWEKFINNSLNKNQVFLCYFSTHPNALDIDGRLDSDYMPVFNRMARQYPEEGCYTAKLIRYKGNFRYQTNSVQRMI